jgi:hypothetical protein
MIILHVVENNLVSKKLSKWLSLSLKQIQIQYK